MRQRTPQTTIVALNLAPMVDVMMCLLIFFLLATKMVEQENARIDLPLALAAKDVEKQELGHRIVVNVKKDEEAKAVYVIREREMNLEEVDEQLVMEAKLQPDLNCVIRADREVGYEHVQGVMSGCARAGISRITFGALRGLAEGGR